MSVINQMLKDLDQRQSQSEPLPESTLSAASYLSERRGDSRRFINIGLISILIFIMIASYFFYQPTVQTAINNKAADNLQSISEPSSEKLANQTIDSYPAPILAVETNAITKEPPESLMTVRGDKKEVELQTQAATNILSVSNSSVAEKVEPASVIKSLAVVDVNIRTSQLYRAAQKSIESSDYEKALGELQKALSLDASLHKARILRYSLLLQTQQLTGLEEQLKISITNWPAVYQYRQLQARILSQKGQQQSAFDLLAANVPRLQPKVKASLEFHALLAYLAQQTSNDAMAIRQYQLLLQQQSSRSEWWLGLAVSKERLGEKSAALRAYRQSISRPGLAQNVQQYAKQRIKILQGY